MAKESGYDSCQGKIFSLLNSIQIGLGSPSFLYNGTVGSDQNMELSSSSSEVKNAWSYTSAHSSYMLMAWCVIS
jgi:hypothetical protein